MIIHFRKNLKYLAIIPKYHVLLKAREISRIPSGNKTKRPQPYIEHQERVHRNTYSIPYHPTPPEDAYACGEGPSNENDIYRYTRDHEEAQRREEPGDDEGEERVAYYSDRLEE